MKRKFYLSSVFAACMSLYAASANAQAPVITTGPTSDTVCQGTITTMTMAATGASSYKWMVSTDGGATYSFVTNGGDYSGATTASLEITAALPMNGYRYRGVAYEGADSARTLPAFLGVDPITSAMPITGPTLVCAGGSVLLANANTAGTHTWSASNGVVSIAGNGTVTAGLAYGKDTITYTFSNACPGVYTSSLIVTVDTVLAHGVISGTTTTICAGTWATLSETLTDGMWISSNTGVATIDGSGNVTGVSAGTTVISYYRANGCGAIIDTYGFTVESAAGPIMSSTDSVGIGATLALSNAVTGGSWSIANAAIAAVGSSSGVATGVAAGSVTITYDVTNVCGTSQSLMTVYVGSAPNAGVITGSDSVCTGAQTTLSNAVPGGTWTVANSTLATVGASTGIVSGLAYGQDTIYYTVHNAFGTSTVRKKVFVNQPPVITISGPSVVALSGGYSLSATPTGGTWTQSNDTVAPLIAYGYFVVLKSGSDTFYYHATNTCGTTVQSFSVYLARVPGVGVENVNNGAAFNVYPNPGNGAFMITIPAATEEDAEVIITNVAGQTVKTMNAKTGQNTSVVFDQPAGLYLISATTASGTRYTARVSVVK